MTTKMNNQARAELDDQVTKQIKTLNHNFLFQRKKRTYISNAKRKTLIHYFKNQTAPEIKSNDTISNRKEF